ncbi:hypothetical protein HK102_009408 [Quaeritorhiza haematococci]|nr:hypothetical protein HK102_009408 [Quaeritorhiza haematococci]
MDPNLAEKNVSNLTTNQEPRNGRAMASQGTVTDQEVFLGSRTKTETNRTGQGFGGNRMNSMPSQYSETKKRIQFAFPVDIAKAGGVQPVDNWNQTYLLTDPGKEQQAI